MSLKNLETVASKAGDMKAVSTVARRVLDLISSDSTTSAILGDALSKDQSLAAHILKVANSAFYSLSREITTLPMAVSVLGLRNLRDQILVATARGAYKRFGITEKMLWTHSVASGIGSRLIARRLFPQLQEDAFICGLLHDVGKVVLNNECPEEFSEVMMLTYNEGYTYVQAEIQVFGYTHTQLGAMISRNWNYPHIITETIFRHHSDEETRPALEDKDTLRILSCVDLSNTACKILGIGYRDAKPGINLAERPSSKLFNLPTQQLADLAPQIETAYEKESAGWSL
jgi:putative nucleotidyltransferase with HDIG domain